MHLKDSEHFHFSIGEDLGLFSTMPLSCSCSMLMPSWTPSWFKKILSGLGHMVSVIACQMFSLDSQHQQNITIHPLIYRQFPCCCPNFWHQKSKHLFYCENFTTYRYFGGKVILAPLLFAVFIYLGYLGAYKKKKIESSIISTIITINCWVFFFKQADEN